VTTSRDARPYQGLLIAFCGLDGSGKTTQAALTARRIADQRPTKVVRPVTAGFRRDPTVSGFLDGTMPAEERAEAVAEIALISAADRYRQLRTVIYPLLRSGTAVLTDRYVYSTYAWALARGLDDVDWLCRLNRYMPRPDLTIYLDIRPQTAVDRVRARGDRPRWEELDLARAQRARTAFLTQPWGKHEQYLCLDGELPLETVSEQVSKLVDELLERHPHAE
jgi:dTMP kinase